MSMERRKLSSKLKKFGNILDNFYSNYIIILYTGIGYIEEKND